MRTTTKLIIKKLCKIINALLHTHKKFFFFNYDILFKISDLTIQQSSFQAEFVMGVQKCTTHILLFLQEMLQFTIE